METPSVEQRALFYLAKTSGALHKQLGHGSDGTVWKTSRATALKAFHHRKNYETELECYQRLLESGTTAIQGFSVPELLGFDDEHLVIEIAIVKPPYILDFGKVYLDRPPAHFSRQVMDDWHEQQAERWGELWPTIRKILANLRGLGIHHMDPKPGNILPENWDPEF